MPSTDAHLRQGIVDALGRLCEGSLRVGAVGLFHALGYRSDRTADAGAVEEFLETYQAAEKLSEKQLTLLRCWTEVEIVFQVTETEMCNRQTEKARQELGIEEFRSILFLAVKLPNRTYSRAHFAATTRAINRLFDMPVVILFRHEMSATMAVIHRRLHKLNSDRDVLERVSLVKDIACLEPHRGQVDVLTDIGRLATDPQIHSFNELHDEFLKTFDIEMLSRRFYCDIFQWFQWATEDCSFPDDGRSGSDERHVIRLITRLMFIWFLKEQGLVPDVLFTEQFARKVLKSYDRNSTHYYRAVLQNLFFATLNTQAEERSFQDDTSHNQSNSNKYNYYSLLVAPDLLTDVLRTIPFVNGGLFDCLDGITHGTSTDTSLDLFGDKYTSQCESVLSVPARIFFDDERGLFSLFRAYKFTVQESTPLEHEVALDPELLGSVFENLLAAYNPETREHARHATGSYYTPKMVVEYMVRNAISLALSMKLAKGQTGADWQDRLALLVDDTRPPDVNRLLSDEDRLDVIEAIADFTVLDPAVGSGAFLMSVLHSLTLVLQRVDPSGALWAAAQERRGRARAFALGTVGGVGEPVGSPPSIGDDGIQRHATNYSRKLYLIQNSLFGVDIQPIACQISKLRFFISLAIEQTHEGVETHKQFRPLPNLETRLVAANTLVRQIHQRVLSTREADEVDRQLLDNRERYFHAMTSDVKLQCRDDDKILRAMLSKSLCSTGLSNHSASQLSEWDPYDPNSSATWFEPQYMFGRVDFDVVIGNPPYIQLQKNAGRLRQIYSSEGYHTFAATGDIYQLFFERGVGLLSPGGILAYIASNSWLKAKYGERMRQFLATKHTPLQLIEMGKGVFENTIVDTAVLLLRKGRREPTKCLAVDKDDFGDGQFPPAPDKWGELRTSKGTPWIVLSRTERDIMEKMEAVGRPLSEWDISIYRGILTGYNDAFIVTQAVRDQLVYEHPASSELLKPILRGRDIRRYHAQWAGLWLIATMPAMQVDIDMYPAIKRHLLSFGKARLTQDGRDLGDGHRSRKKTCHEWYELQDTCAYHTQFEGPKLYWMHMSPEARFSYVEAPIYCNAKGYMISGENLKFLSAVLNSDLSTYYIRKIAVTTGMGLTQWNKFVVEQIPVPRPSDNTRAMIEKLVDQRLLATDPERIFILESAINDQVLNLYRLSQQEVNLLESTLQH